MSWKIALPICILILAAAAGVLGIIFTTEPTAQRSGATKATAMLVAVETVERGDYRPTVVALGTVRPEREIVLRPRVEGEVLARHPRFTPGGIVERGSVLVELDPADYQTALGRAESALAEAEAALAIEQGRKRVAEQDYRAFDRELPDERKALALREPQLRTARARVDAARAAVERAELDLARTRIVAPFDAMVLRRLVDVGSQVGAGDQLAHLVGTDTYWVEATVPLAKLPWLAIPEGEEPGAAVTLRNRTAWPQAATREGRIHRLIGALDDETRLARVLVAVEDALARGEAAAGVRLVIGEVLEARIEGELLSDVVRLPRALLRSGDTVWTMVDGVLRIRDVHVAFSDQAPVRT